ncbi:hypothetical protein BDV27DRAFT_131167, partial [Aspergillus caelatus]
MACDCGNTCGCSGPQSCTCGEACQCKNCGVSIAIDDWVLYDADYLQRSKSFARTWLLAMNPVQAYDI